MATAMVGAALLLPPLPAMALFTALGLGIALPFLALALVPALRRALPKPGAWMTGFRRWMALPMVLTALALAWLASRVGGTGFALGVAALAVLLVAVLWLAGRRQRRGQSAGVPILAGSGLLALAAFTALPPLVAPPAATAQGVVPAQPFTEARLAQARASGKPVFVWMTADWCITCKVNEQTAIEREATAEAFRKAGVIAWARRLDPARSGDHPLPPPTARQACPSTSGIRREAGRACNCRKCSPQIC